MDSIQTFDSTSEALSHEADTFSFEAPASPVDENNERVFFGDRNEGQTIPFALDA
ncbi:MAG TPA: hypothetical protein VD948_07860 [Rhodothermales bacterium]|nr:hypothetical protein [Rhodothermales bacterium]